MLRDRIVTTRSHLETTRSFLVTTRSFLITTRCASCNYATASRNYEIVSRNYDIASLNYEIVSRNYEIVKTYFVVHTGVRRTQSIMLMSLYVFWSHLDEMYMYNGVLWPLPLGGCWSFNFFMDVYKSWMCVHLIARLLQRVARLGP